MPFSFPSSPSVGATSTQNGRSYTYAGNGVWELTATGGGSGSIVTAATVPAFPATGSASNLYITTEDQRIWRWDSTASIYVESGPIGGGFALASVPASATSPGSTGQIAADGSHWYYCSAPNTWVRTALSTWTNFTPASVTGLQLWLDASDASSLYDATTGGSLVAADGGVARWEDKSGNGRHFTQATSGSRPTRKTAIQNSLAVLRFDGGDSVSMPSSTATFNFLHDGDSTVFVVFKAGTTANPEALYWVMANNISDNSIDGKTGFYLRWDDRTSANADLTDSLIHLVSNSAGFARFVGNAKNGFPANTFALATVRGDIANATIASRSQIRRNGGSAITLLTGNTDAGTALPTANASDNFTIGDQSGSVKGSGLNGDIAEIIMYDTALSDTDRAAVEGYLMSKWGIT